MEYKKESFGMFEELRARMEEETIRYLYLFEPVSREEQEEREKERAEVRRNLKKEQNLVYSAGDSGQPAPTKKRETAKVGRNDPCPCGSGKKYKKCHGK
jgi:preprotein translocase subunit SecA